MRNDRNTQPAEKIISTALKVAKELDLPKAAIAVFDEEGEMLNIGTYGKNKKKSEIDCRMKLKSLLDKKPLTEVAGFRDVFIKLLGKLIGKNEGVQGVVKVKRFGYVTAMCVFDSSKDVQVIHQTLMELEYVLEEGEAVWEPHKKFVYSEPGWATYIKKAA